MTGVRTGDRESRTAVTSGVVRPRLAVRATAVGAGGLALGMALLLNIRQFTHFEAMLNGRLLHTFGQSGAGTVGSVVVFNADGRLVGLLITTGCSVSVPLLVPLVLVTLLVAVGRVTVRRGIAVLAATATMLLLVNQVRMAVIVASVDAWGFQLGYERSHVLLGSAIATLGMAAVAVFLVAMLGRVRPPWAWSTRHGQ